MTTVFGDYSRYYNLLYRDKDYTAEADFVLEAFARQGCAPRTLLDLGCGTGKHALCLARHGVAVTGVDMSATMLDMGRAELATLPAPRPEPLPELLPGDARSVRLGRTFDAVSSLFHVMSYQNTEQDALAMLETAKTHLSPGGLFLFDFWYGPGVLTDPPVAREKRMEDDQIVVNRQARPKHNVNNNLVAVHYDIAMTDKASGHVSHLQETHSMRYWFMPELRHLAREAGLEPCAEGAWLRHEPATVDTWNAWMLVRRPEQA